MVELSPLFVVGWTAVGGVVVAWLLATFMPAPLARTRAAWLGATALYVAIGSLFASLFLRARADESLVQMIAFGFLLLLFTSGLLLSLVRLFASFRSTPSSSEHATH